MSKYSGSLGEIMKLEKRSAFISTEAMPINAFLSRLFRLGMMIRS
jgi:hypothetical protein